MKNLGLASLLSPVTEDDFFKNYWPRNPLFISASNKLKSLIELSELKDLNSLLSNRVLKVRACLPDYDDEYSSLMIDPEDALKAYRNGMTLVFDAMQTQSEGVADFLKQLRSDLGLVTGGAADDLTRSRAMAYATPAGGRTRLHFDANANFVVQLKGTKCWWLAPNTSVNNPTERYTSCTGEIIDALEKQCHAQLLDELPDDSLAFTLEPGSVLFVPRGYWHQTATDEDSLSLTFTFSQPTWADVLAKSIHGHLLQSEVWRELADGLEGPDPKRKKEAITRFEILVKKLAEELMGMKAANLLAHANLIKFCRVSPDRIYPE